MYTPKGDNADTLQAKFEAKRNMIESNQMFTSSAIKDHLLGTHHRNKMLIQDFEDYIQKVKK